MLWHTISAIFAVFITLLGVYQGIELDSLSSSPCLPFSTSSLPTSTLLARMPEPENEKLSLADLFNFMKESEENRNRDMKALEEKLSQDRINDKMELSKDIAVLTATLKDTVKSGVKEEIEAAIDPIKEKQDALAIDQSKLAVKILELEKKFNSIPPGHPSIASSSAETPSRSLSSPSPPSSESHNPDEASLRKIAVQAAKKILGFTKIDSHHIQQAIDEHGLDPDDSEVARVCAVYDFLHYEMKVPVEEVKKMKIVKTFRPSKQPDSDRLYAEFEEEASILLINRYVRNLQPDSNVDIWVPPSLYQRFREFDTAAYKLRSGPDKVKTRVKYGDSDFILMKKSPSCHSWTNVIPENLSPYNPNPPSFLNPSGSPPVGRDSRDKKRKTLSPTNRSPQRKKSFRSALNEDCTEIVEVQRDIELTENIENPQKKASTLSNQSLN